jgi:hypothetical protein
MIGMPTVTMLTAMTKFRSLSKQSVDEGKVIYQESECAQPLREAGHGSPRSTAPVGRAGDQALDRVGHAWGNAQDGEGSNTGIKQAIIISALRGIKLDRFVLMSR